MQTLDIRRLRRDLGLNQVEFAQLTGVHPITVSKWERHQAAPTAYQNALFHQFREASRDQEVRKTLKNVLVAMGVVLALALLLRHLMKK